MDVKYIPSEWEKTKKGIGDLVGLGVWGKGMIDKLKDLNDLLEDVQADIAKYDTDGVISFTHTDRKKQYQQLYEDYLVLHRFSSRVGEIVDRTIDDLFYQEIDAFVEAMHNLSISKIKTKNHIGAKKTVVAPGAYGTQQTIDVPKAEVGLEDLFSGSNYYAKLVEREYASWKELNPKANFSKQEYIQKALNSQAFQYESIKDGQMNKEFWGQITALAVIVGTSFICPPAGMALGAAYGTLELSSAVSGKDWISGRELKTDERVFRGVLSPLDIVPGVKGLSTFSSAARFSHLREASDLKLLATKTGLQSKSFVRDMVVRAENGIFPRIRNAKSLAKEIPHHLKNKSANSALKAGRFVDNALTNLKNSIPGRQMGLAMEGIGNVKVPPENTNGLENKVRAYLSEKTGLNLLGEGKAGNDGVELGTKGTVNLNSVPSVKNGEFNRWFNSLAPDKFDKVWSDPRLRKAIESRLRHPGGFHEWHLVSRAPTFKRWGITAEQIKELRTAIEDVKFVNPKGVHGGKGSTKAHNELLEIIDSSPDYATFKRRLQNWANYRLEGGVESLPESLRP
ncbi:hypothetical protein RI196_01130 [Aeribacillus composti]|uniref:Uncharacterized protein n=1 Tax=Aeribacillus composti TaxID=1868734 RepID=A0ABY9WB37_9BACI|nr:hypothetical protein [Aeribacillus composti]WNF33350.1 hypothetical protein RI196_01130 [Aeribacillus composti]